MIIDYNIGGRSKTLVTSVSFFSGLLPWIFYLNILAALSASYLLICDILNGKTQGVEDKFSKRNLIIMGCLLAIGILIVVGQNIFGNMPTLEFQSN